MMSFAEWVTVLSVTGVTGLVIVTCFVYLIRKLMKESAAKAVSVHKAEENAVAVEALRRADEIIADRVELSRISERLRSQQF